MIIGELCENLNLLYDVYFFISFDYRMFYVIWYFVEFY